MELNDFRLLVDAARLDWERWCDSYFNLTAKATMGAPVDRAQIESVRAQMKRALSDFFALTTQVEDAGN
jgi:hypothetical protein